MNIKRMIEEDNRIGNFINGEFLSYAEQNNVDLNSVLLRKAMMVR